MTERDEALFEQAGALLRRGSPRDDEALEATLDVVRAAAESAGDGVHASARARGRRRARGSALFGRGTARYVAGLAAGITFAAGLGIGIAAGWRMRGATVPAVVDRLGAPQTVERLGAPQAMDAANAATRVVEFSFVAPSATRVALVGEFNGWDPAATPMVRSTAGEWRVRLPLGGGRHVYAFVVDGAAWMPDPRAPLAAERWFGSPNSVLLIGGGSL